MRRALVLFAAIVLAVSACASYPDGAYYPTPRAPGAVTLSHTLYRAAAAAGDDPGRYSFALVESDAVTALAAEDATFYFSEGLARQPRTVIDALVAQKVAHEVLGHVGKRRVVSLSVTAGFTALGIALPGLGFLDVLVNPLIIRAFTRDQVLDADQRAVEILREMGHRAPRRTLAAALRAAGEANGPVEGGLLAFEPALGERLVRLEPLEVTARRPAPAVR